MPPRKKIEPEPGQELVVAPNQTVLPPPKPVLPTAKLPAKAKGGELVGLTQKFEQSLVAGKVPPDVSKLIKFARNSYNQSIQTVPLPWPQMNQILYPGRADMPPGMPKGRIMEIFSRTTGVGRSTLAAQIMAAWQHQYNRVLFADPDGKTTVDYLQILGCILDELDPRKMALFQVEPPNPFVKFTAEQWMDAITKLSPYVDLSVIDSIGALQRAADADKKMKDANMVGGLGQIMGNFCRDVSRNTATLFINQTRYAPGQFSPNGPAMTQMGGLAIRNFASIRLQMSPVMNGEIVDGANNVIGFEVELKTIKNAVGFTGRKCIIHYLNGLGFSPWWGYLVLGIQKKVISKSGSWFEFEKWKFQGEPKFHYNLVHDPELFGRLQEVIDSKTIGQAFTGDAQEPTAAEQEEEKRLDDAANQAFGEQNVA